MDPASDHRGLIQRLGAAKLSTVLDVDGGGVRAMAARNRIPPEHWPRLIEFAREQDVEVSATWLMLTTPARRHPTPTQDAA